MGLLKILVVLLLYTFTLVNSSPPHKRLSDEEYEKLLEREKGKQKPNQEEHQNTVNLDQLGIEYQRYLQQVIETLESDDQFKKKLESANEVDIRSGKIAEELEYVSHHVRSKLDELKRIELDRLRQLAKKQHELMNGDYDPTPPGHLDHSNPHSFEIADLQKLIYKVAEDLQEADKKRKELFKEYEMQKHFERDQKLSNMTEEERKQFYDHEKEEEIKRKSASKKVHHPGSKQQLEEVWEKQDHLDKQDFNPKVFFALHDVDNNGFLDEDEVKALFINELNKLYPKSDLVERDEELERMREHVFNEVDLNKDRLISWEEFYKMSLQPEFNKDSGWQPIDEQHEYTSDELAAFERRRQEEVNQLVQQGKIPQVPAYHYPSHGEFDYLQMPPRGYPYGNAPPPGQHGVPLDQYYQQQPHHQQGYQQPAFHGYQQGQQYQYQQPAEHGYQQRPPQQQGYQRPPPQQQGYQRPPPQQHGYQQPPLEQHGYQQPPLEQHGYQQPPIEQHGYQQPPIEQHGYQQPPPQQHGYQQPPPQQYGYRQPPQQQQNSNQQPHQQQPKQLHQPSSQSQFQDVPQNNEIPNQQYAAPTPDLQKAAKPLQKPNVIEENNAQAREREQPVFASVNDGFKPQPVLQNVDSDKAETRH